MPFSGEFEIDMDMRAVHNLYMVQKPLQYIPVQGSNIPILLKESDKRVALPPGLLDFQQIGPQPFDLLFLL